MKIILSRKGFDSATGKAPSPIIDGRPISLPIPVPRSSGTSYEEIGLGDVVERVTAGRIRRDHYCHHDPMFINDECIFGQSGAAQSHLARCGVGNGDIFLFFGLFAAETTGEVHHRLFGYLRIAQVLRTGELEAGQRDRLVSLRHPHVWGDRQANDTIYRGEGRAAYSAVDALRLTQRASRPSRWEVPPWLGQHGLSYNRSPVRWKGANVLLASSRGQEFVCDIGEDRRARTWVERIIGLIRP